MEAIVSNACWLVTQVVTSLVRYDQAISVSDEVINLAAPREPKLGKTVQEYQRFTTFRPGKHDMQPDAVNVENAKLKRRRDL
jgi:hypothetical protein